MELTEVRVTLFRDERLRAFVNVVFDDAFIVRGVKIIDGPKGLCVSMPGLWLLTITMEIVEMLSTRIGISTPLLPISGGKRATNGLSLSMTYSE